MFDLTTIMTVAENGKPDNETNLIVYWSLETIHAYYPIIDLGDK